MSRPAELHVLRLVPGASPIHRLWAGTKLVTVVALSVALSINPSWVALAVVGSALALGLIVARIPRGAAPRLPRWFWLALGAGGLLTLGSSRAPHVHLAGYSIGVGGVEEWLRLTLLGAIILGLAWLLSWTTPLADIAPALAKLGAPLRLLQVPVDELAVSVALGARCLPLLIDEVRTLLAARRLRQRPGHQPGWRARIQEPHLLLSAALIVALRRASELARAIDARGGVAGVVLSGDGSASPHRRDMVALAIVATVAAAAIIL
jgi:energy-coupling factor transporter transmembrane protein EcfT